MSLLFFYAALALGISFLCSLLEAVILSVSPSYVARLEDSGHRASTTLRDLKARIDRPLAAILSLNTFAHTIGAAGVGAQAQAIWGSHVLAFVSAVLTLLVLFLSEIVPKSLGARYWRVLAPPSARLLAVMIRLLLPLVVVCEALSRTLTRTGAEEPAISRQEVAAVTRLGTDLGLFVESESRILANLFRLSSLRAQDIMTPRTVMASLPVSTTVGEFLADQPATPFSRVPIWRADEDDVVGYVIRHDVLLAATRDESEQTMEKYLRKIPIIPETLPLMRVIESFVEEDEHLAVAVDEYGGVAGVVTMEDLIETLLGSEIVDEADTVEDLREMARSRWRRRAHRLGLITEGGLPASEDAST